MPTQDTKDRILAAAEQLIAEHGFAGTSLRNVTTAAGVNLAAVHYHFGTKEALLRAVFARRITPVNEQRLTTLDRLESKGAPVAVEDIIEAFLSPVIELKHDLEGEGMVWSRFIGRVLSEPPEVVEPMIGDQFSDVVQRFVGALSQTLPDLHPAEILERLQFAIGMMTHQLTDLHRIAVSNELRFEPPNGADSLRHMVAFLSAAFRAPATRSDSFPETSLESKAS
jgi:AcrR family transcriptional regulator